MACQGGIHVGTLRGMLHAAAHRCTQHHRRQTLSSIGRERTIAYSRAVRSRSRGNGSRPAPWAGSAVAPVSRRLPPSDTAILCCSGSVTCVIPRPIGCSSLPSNWLQALEISLTPCNNGRKQRIVRPVSQKFVGQKTWPQAHTWPVCCEAIPRIFLIASPAYGPGACHLGLCEPLWRSLKLATSSLNPGESGIFLHVGRLQCSKYTL